MWVPIIIIHRYYKLLLLRIYSVAITQNWLTTKMQNNRWIVIKIEYKSKKRFWVNSYFIIYLLYLNFLYSFEKQIFLSLAWIKVINTILLINYHFPGVTNCIYSNHLNLDLQMFWISFLYMPQNRELTNGKH